MCKSTVAIPDGVCGSNSLATIAAATIPVRVIDIVHTPLNTGKGDAPPSLFLSARITVADTAK